MKGFTAWNHRPFRPQSHRWEADLPCVCRIAPDTGAFTFQWLDNGFSGDHTVTWQKADSDAPAGSMTVTSDCVTVSGLEDHVDYRFTLSRVGEEGSVTRLVRTGAMPGDVPVNYLHPLDETYRFSGRFLGTPGMVRCPSGKLIAAHDVFCGREYHAILTQLFASEDNGKTWRWINDLMPCYWPNLFVHRNKLYCLAASHGAGHIIIGRSDDEGETWTAPVILFPAGYEEGTQKGPCKIGEKNGRLYFEFSCGAWKYNDFRMGYLSVPADADLMDPANWTAADFLQYDPGWPGSPKDAGPGLAASGAGIEGHFITGPEGKLHCLYRMDIKAAEPNTGKMLMLDVDDDDPEKPLSFHAIVDCPLGSNSKFDPDYDPVSGYYVMLGTEQPSGNPNQRNILSMAISKDLKNWRVVHRIYDFSAMDPKKHGVQYPDWIFDGDDILLLVRLGFNEPDTYHNSNCIAFARLANFRQYFD